MGFHESRKRGRDRLRQLRRETFDAEDEMQSERERFDTLRGSEATRAVSAFNLFQTPAAIAAKLATAAEVGNAGRILEPSAGLGRIYQAIRAQTNAETILVEIAPQCAAELYRATSADDSARLIQDDFLQCDAARLGGLFDCVVMNPPFKLGRDVKHIRHATSLLKPGGRIVSLCFDGMKQRAAFFGVPGWHWQPLPADSFKAEGTRAAVAVVSNFEFCWESV